MQKLTTGNYLDLLQKERLLRAEGSTEELFFVRKQIDSFETKVREGYKKALTK
jgi:hypothetical protein